jgi:chaperone BCS1
VNVGGSRNDILQKAIKLYISHLNIKLSDSEVTFVEKSDNRQDQNRFVNQAEKMRSFVFNRMPSDERFAEVRPGLEIMRSERGNPSGGDPNAKKSASSADKNPDMSNVHYYFRAKNPDGDRVIDDFLQECIDWYIKDLDSMNDNNRYLYVLQNKNTSDSSPGRGPGRRDDDQLNESNFRYKRYKLGDYKTFRNLFMKEKQPLLKLIDQFMNRTGKYAIPGYPHKLGLLLHGPPGYFVLIFPFKSKAFMAN